MKKRSASQTAPKPSWKNAILLAITALALSMSAAFGASTNWKDGTGSWFDCNNGGTTSGAGGTGLLTVTNGGTVTAASVHVYPSGTLTGNSTVTTTSGTTIDGTLTPSGQLTIGGGLQLDSGATMTSSVTQQAWDNVNVTGAASLGGRLSVTMTGTFTTPAQFPLLHASSLTGSFSSYSFTYTGCLSPSIVYDRANGYVYLHVESSCQ